jgi:hypothetical protein
MAEPLEHKCPAVVIDVINERESHLMTDRIGTVFAIPHAGRYRGITTWVLAGMIMVFMVFRPGVSSATDISQFGSLQLGAQLDTNLMRTFDPSIREKGKLSSVAVAVGWRFQITHQTRINVSADFDGASYVEYHKLNNHSAGLTAALTYKPGLGPFALWFRAYGSAARHRFTDDIRDGSQFTIGMQVGKKLGNLLSVTAGYEEQSRSATKNNVFNGHGKTTNFTASVPFIRGSTVTAGYGVRHGDVTAHADGYWPPGTPWMVDAAYDDPLDAYRIRAVTKMYSGTVSIPLIANVSLYIKAEKQNTRWQSERYPNNVYQAGVIYSFR